MPIARAQMMGNLQGQEYNMLMDAGLNIAGLSYKERVAAGAIEDTEENRKNFLANFKQYVMDGNLTAEQLNRTLKYAGEVEYKGAADKAKNNLDVIMSGLYDQFSLAGERLFTTLDKVYDIKGKLKSLGAWFAGLKFTESDVKLVGDIVIGIGGLVGGLMALNTALGALKWVGAFAGGIITLMSSPVVGGLFATGGAIWALMQMANTEKDPDDVPAAGIDIDVDDASYGYLADKMGGGGAMVNIIIQDATENGISATAGDN